MGWSARTAKLRDRTTPKEALLHLLLVDRKALGKPTTFDSTDHKRFPGWKFKFTNFVTAICDKAERYWIGVGAKKALGTASAVGLSELATR